jgi:DHA2 family multidrug resistance protein-like MFS transporter
VATSPRPRPRPPAGEAGPAADEAELAPRRQWAALAVLLLAVLIVSIDNTVLGFAVPALSEDLAPTSAELLWIVDVYAFTLAGLLVTMGTLGDRIGRRRLLLIGAAGFGVASALAAASTSAGMLIASRALLGVAGATLMPSTLSLLRNVFPDERRRRLAIGIWTSAFAAGAAIGPILGGWLLEHAWWGSVFLVNLPVMAALLVLGPLLLPESRDPAPGRFDLPSAALSLAAVLPVVYGVKLWAEGGAIGSVLALIAAGLGLGAAFVVRQLRLDDPLLDVRLFAHRTFSVAIAVNLVGNLALVGSLFFVAQHFQLVGGLSPLEAGLHLLPGMLAAMGASIGSSLLLRRGAPVAVLLGVALTVAASGYLAMLGLGAEGGGTLLAGAMVLVGLGVGGATSVGANLVLGSVPARRAGAASGLSETAFELGAALGTAILGSVLVAVYRRDLAVPADVEAVDADAATQTIGGALEVAASLPAAVGDVLAAAARSAFTSGVHAAALVGAALLLAMAATAAILLRGVRATTTPDHP